MSSLRHHRAPSPRRLPPFAWVAAALVVVLAGVLVVRLATGKAEPPPTATTSPSSSASSPSIVPTTTGGATSPSTALVAPPPCEYDDQAALLTGYGDWTRTLLDTTYRLDETYAPPDLVSASEAGFREGFLVRELVVADLAALRAAAEEAGAPLDLIATYRTYDQQAELFDLRVQQLGEEEALKHAARAGHSEHQLGTAVDFKTPGADDVDASWADSPQGLWLAANAWTFGFVLSYPDGLTDVTCYTFEPWHFRYVGRDLAADVQASELTLRQYLWHWQELGTPPSG